MSTTSWAVPNKRHARSPRYGPFINGLSNIILTTHENLFTPVEPVTRFTFLSYPSSNIIWKNSASRSTPLDQIPTNPSLDTAAVEIESRLPLQWHTAHSPALFFLESSFIYSHFSSSIFLIYYLFLFLIFLSLRPSLSSSSVLYVLDACVFLHSIIKPGEWRHWGSSCRWTIIVLRPYITAP